MTLCDTYLTPHEKRALRSLADDVGGMRELALVMGLSPTSLYRYLRVDIRIAWQTRARCNARAEQLKLVPPFHSQQTTEWLVAASLQGE